MSRRQTPAPLMSHADPKLKATYAQVLANTSSELQEGTDISREQLKAVGIRPYDEKVCGGTLRG